MLTHGYKNLGILLLSLLLVPAAVGQITSDDVGTEKLAQTGFKFLKISTDARVAAMAGAMTATDLGSSVAMFYNPAGMATQEAQISASFGYTQWIADFNYSSASAAFNTGGYGIVGVSLIFADYGEDFIGTVVASNEAGYSEYGDIGLSNPAPTAFAVGVGYANAITDRFSVGGNVKYASQDLGTIAVGTGGVVESNELSTLAFDFGVLYKTGYESFNLAMSVRNFAQELNYVDENFELPLTFNVGVSMDVMDLTSAGSSNSLLVSVEAERPRDFPEQLRLGAEYSFSDLLFVRAGYLFPTDEEGVSLGAGVRHELSGVGFGVDYSFTTFGVFDNVQRFGLQLHF